VTSDSDGTAGDNLLKLLDLDSGPVTDSNSFCAFDDGAWPGGAMFGGQLAAQSLVAATRTVRPELRVHSLHVYFMRPGVVPGAVDFQVERLRDGGSFSTRAVSVRQGESELARVMMSFHVDEPSEQYQLTMPADAGDPRDVPRSPGLEDLRLARGIESRELGAASRDADGTYRATRRAWMRFEGKVPDERGLNEAVMTFMSDIGAHFSARLPILGPTPRADMRRSVLSVSIDHAIWFHQPARADEWLYYELQALTHQNSRAVTRGRFFTEDGDLVASVAQEILIRTLEGKSA
jgi:acyl-CoA thioesterase II